ncbi:GGDEF domain-containing protein [Actinoplanes sp. NPDC049316]|uniref:GGDEF domain-containing protein n=1 Tax=Actinoplanes sp. NPDC049316 TaxID=3154727 RepID=UPI00342C2106
MRWPRATVPAWVVHAGFLGVLLLAGTAYASGGRDQRVVVYTAVTVLPILTFLAALASGNLPDRRPWLLAVAGLVMLFLQHLAWPEWIVDAHLGRAEGALPDLSQSLAHSLFLLGTAMALRRRASADPGGIIDAALFGLCSGGPLWEWVVRPHLPPGAPPIGQALLLGDLLVLCGVAGCLLRLGMMGRPGRGTLAYLVLTAILTLGSTVMSALSPGGSGVWSAELMLAAYLTIASAPVHPDAAEVTTPPHTGAVVSRQRLGWLALALSANPLIAAVQVVRGEGSASLLLPMGSLLVVPLVLLRIHLLSAQRDRAERTLAFHATHDELTGLHNRRHMAAEIDRALADLDRGVLDEVTVLLCDLDGFKPVNDRYGHPAGDAVLREVASRLTAAVRAEDVVGRLGGDEFLILCRGAAGLDAGELRHRITAAVREPIAVLGATVSVGVTTGVAQARPGRCADRDMLIGIADAAMYAGKTRRRDEARERPTRLPSP